MLRTTPICDLLPYLTTGGKDVCDDKRVASYGVQGGASLLPRAVPLCASTFAIHTLKEESVGRIPSRATLEEQSFKDLMHFSHRLCSGLCCVSHGFSRSLWRGLRSLRLIAVRRGLYF